MMKVIYVVGLTHSGSTALGIQVADRFEGLALGEPYRVFARIESEKMGEGTLGECSCGETHRECSFWSAFMEKYDAYKETGRRPTFEQLVRAYELMLETAERQGERLLVDTSKGAVLLPVLAHLKEKGRIDYRVLLTVRDPRGWARSDQNMKIRNGKKKMILPRHFRAWNIENTQLVKHIEDEKCPYMIVGHEEMCFEPDQTFKRISAFCEEALVSNTHTRSTHHIVHSNRMKKKTEESRVITYDSSWMTDWPVNIVACLYPGLLRTAKRLVYSRDAGKK